MTRKKKTPPAERRELERQRRINAPEEREKRKAAIDEAKARAAQERAVQPDPVIEREPEPAPVPDAPVAAPYTGFQAARGTLKFTDAGDAGGSCRRDQVQKPAPFWACTTPPAPNPKTTAAWSTSVRIWPKPDRKITSCLTNMPMIYLPGGKTRPKTKKHPRLPIFLVIPS